MFTRFIVSAALLSAIGLGVTGGAYSYAKISQYKDEILQLQAFCEARDLTPTFATVERVIDGDTYKLSSKQTVRLLGPDTPEICHHKSNGELRDPECEDEYLGPEATAFAKDMVEGQEVVLIGDPAVGNRDHFGRLLRYVFVREKSVGLELVREGYAPVYDKLTPRAKFYDALQAAEISAREKGRGLWGIK